MTTVTQKAANETGRPRHRPKHRHDSGGRRKQQQLPHAPVGARAGTEARNHILQAIADLLQAPGGRWRIHLDVQTVGPGPGGIELLDADGGVVAVIEERRERDDASDVRRVLDGLVAAYQAVLSSELATRRAEAHAALAEQAAYRDPLTDLPNRRAWDEAMAREQARCDRNEASVAIAVVDLDELKVVNDTDGHLAGDLLIRRAANVLSKVFRGSDVVARIGGDEFGVLLVDHDGDVAGLAARIDRTLVQSGIRASVGAAAHTTGERLRDVFHRADTAMYRRKRTR